MYRAPGKVRQDRVTALPCLVAPSAEDHYGRRAKTPIQATTTHRRASRANAMSRRRHNGRRPDGWQCHSDGLNAPVLIQCRHYDRHW